MRRSRFYFNSQLSTTENCPYGTLFFNHLYKIYPLLTYSIYDNLSQVSTTILRDSIPTKVYYAEEMSLLATIPKDTKSLPFKGFGFDYTFGYGCRFGFWKACGDGNLVEQFDMAIYQPDNEGKYVAEELYLSHYYSRYPLCFIPNKSNPEFTDLVVDCFATYLPGEENGLILPTFLSYMNFTLGTNFPLLR